MLGGEEFPGHLGPHPRPVGSGQRRVRRHTGRRLDRPEAFADLEAERADVTINDLERRPQPGRVPVIAWCEVRPLELLLAELGKWVQTAAEHARICSAVTGSPTVRPSIPSMPEPIHTPGVSPRWM